VFLGVFGRFRQDHGWEWESGGELAVSPEWELTLFDKQQYTTTFDQNSTYLALLLSISCHLSLKTCYFLSTIRVWRSCLRH